MSTLSLYNASIPTLNRLMDNLDHILKTGQAHANDKGYSEDALLLARLAPDMFTLTGQVQVATALTKNCPYRVTGTDAPNFEDTEVSFDDLFKRIATTKAELGKFTPQDINGLEGREFSFKLGPMDMEFTGLTYVSGFTLPNVYFHVTTAYNLLRHNGVPLGKMDFFGGAKR